VLFNFAKKQLHRLCALQLWDDYHVLIEAVVCLKQTLPRRYKDLQKRARVQQVAEQLFELVGLDLHNVLHVVKTHQKLLSPFVLKEVLAAVLLDLLQLQVSLVVKEVDEELCELRG
jgi:hypothetical protein